jgi:urocanate hydratase
MQTFTEFEPEAMLAGSRVCLDGTAAGKAASTEALFKDFGISVARLVSGCFDNALSALNEASLQPSSSSP